MFTFSSFDNNMNFFEQHNCIASWLLKAAFTLKSTLIQDVPFFLFNTTYNDHIMLLQVPFSGSHELIIRIFSVCLRHPRLQL